MLKHSKILIPPGAVLVAAAVVTATQPSEDAVSPCFDSHASAMMCTAMPPQLADGPEGGDPEPLQVHRTVAATASSTVVQLSARSMAMATGRATLTLSSA
jgi:hypothetical protein